MLKSLRTTLFTRLFADQLAALRQAFKYTETDSTFRLGTKAWGDLYRDRSNYKRQDILEETLKAWRVNPLARRIVNLTTEYVIGEGLTVNCTDPATLKFIQEFWTHQLNKLDEQLPDACDELTRTGDLFPILTTDRAGMTYQRFAPAEHIEDIQTTDNLQKITPRPYGARAEPALSVVERVRGFSPLTVLADRLELALENCIYPSPFSCTIFLIASDFWGFGKTEWASFPKSGPDFSSVLRAA